jgi:hypothetical protein
MDVALGPNQGQGVPARPDDEGLQWDLVGFPSYRLPKVSIADSASFHMRRQFPRENHSMAHFRAGATAPSLPQYLQSWYQKL